MGAKSPFSGGRADGPQNLDHGAEDPFPVPRTSHDHAQRYGQGEPDPSADQDPRQAGKGVGLQSPAWNRFASGYEEKKNLRCVQRCRQLSDEMGGQKVPAD